MGHSWVSRKLSIRDEPNIRLRCSRNVEKYMFYRSKTSPCVRSKRPRVFRHHAHMCFNMCAWCRYTRGRFESTHGGFFLRARPRYTPHHTKHTHTHQTNRTPTRNNTRRQRQRQTETEKEDRDRERREDGRGETREDGRGETRQEKRRQKKTRQDKRRERRFMFSVVVHGLFC